MNRILLLFALVGAAYWLLAPAEVDPGPSAVAPEVPEQHPITGASSFRHGDYRIRPLATFELTARVLRREDYRLDREADLSPTDLVLGWGQMSDNAVLQAIRITQSQRWYFWRSDQLPIPSRAIETQSANMHMIPADGVVASQLDDVRRGDVVSIVGKLVRVEADDGWRWISSLTRTDTGAHSCEIVWVEELQVH